jgi:hypothetical protein
MARQMSIVVVVLVLGGMVPAFAQQEVASVGGLAPAPEQMRVRFQIAAMEGVLERAVQLGARRLSQQVQAVSPDMLVIAGAARAKGFLLDGYGVFFNVDVPALRRSLAWSFTQLGRPDGSVETAIASLKRNLPSVNDPAARREMDDAIQRLARIVGPIRGPVPGGVAPGVQHVSTEGGGQPVNAPPSLTPQQAAIIDDPGLAYTNAVKSALVDAMLDYGAPIPIGDDQWLTIAARDDNDSRLGGGDPYDVSTIVLRISGADLGAFRAGKLTRDEALAKVEAREY